MLQSYIGFAFCASLVLFNTLAANSSDLKPRNSQASNNVALPLESNSPSFSPEKLNLPAWELLQDVKREFTPTLPKAAATENYQIIAKVFPRIKQIQPIEIEDQPYYILVRNNKIKGIISIWETTQADTVILLVVDKSSQLQEMITMPIMDRINLNKDKIMLNNYLERELNYLSKVLTHLHQQLGQDWSAFIRKIKLNIHKSDAVTQATP